MHWSLLAIIMKGAYIRYSAKCGVKAAWPQRIVSSLPYTYTHTQCIHTTRPWLAHVRRYRRCSEADHIKRDVDTHQEAQKALEKQRKVVAEILYCKENNLPIPADLLPQEKKKVRWDMRGLCHRYIACSALAWLPQVVLAFLASEVFACLAHACLDSM